MVCYGIVRTNRRWREKTALRYPCAEQRGHRELLRKRDLHVPHHRQRESHNHEIAQDVEHSETDLKSVLINTRLRAAKAPGRWKVALHRQSDGSGNHPHADYAEEGVAGEPYRAQRLDRDD